MSAVSMVNRVSFPADELNTRVSEPVSSNSGQLSYPELKQTHLEDFFVKAVNAGLSEPKFKMIPLNIDQYNTVLGRLSAANIPLHNLEATRPQFQIVMQILQEAIAPRSFSSICESKLLTWRNADTFSNKANAVQKVASGLFFGCKAAITALAQPLIEATAIIETVAYAAMKLACTCFKSEKKEYYGDLLNSSAFTMLWAPSVLFYFNPLFVYKAPPAEEFAAKRSLKLIG